METDQTNNNFKSYFKTFKIIGSFDEIYFNKYNKVTCVTD